MSHVETIVGYLLQGRSVVLVGPSNAGKTHWVHTVLIPRLKEAGRSVMYNVGGSGTAKAADITVFDEAETLFDAERLQKNTPVELSYYSKEYLEKVREWHRIYTRHIKPSVYVISRNKGDVQYLVDHFKKTDWDDRDIIVFSFPSPL